MNAVWLFLYLGCLVRLLTLYRLDAKAPATLLMALPILLLPIMDMLCHALPALQKKVTLRVAGLVALSAALVLARSLNLGFWETRQLGLGALCAALGLGLSLVVQSQPKEQGGPGLWVWIAAWEFAGLWHPVLTFVGAGLTAFLCAFGAWPGGRALSATSHRLRPFWPLLLLGLVLPKPWFDFNLEGQWAAAMAVFALATAIAGLSLLRTALDRLPTALLVVMLGLHFFIYPQGWTLYWALAVGLLWGCLWPRFSRPLGRTRSSLGFLLGLLISFALHSNLGIPVLRRLLWWGS